MEDLREQFEADDEHGVKVVRTVAPAEEQNGIRKRKSRNVIVDDNPLASAIFETAAHASFGFRRVSSDIPSMSTCAT